MEGWRDGENWGYIGKHKAIYPGGVLVGAPPTWSRRGGGGAWK
jgi:hypothetical protein